MKFCKYKQVNGELFCEYCRVKLRGRWNAKQLPPRNCPANETASTPQPQLGDRLESLLKKVGITEEKYRELKAMAGLDPTCNCGSRKRFLNKLPAALALGYARGGICEAWRFAIQLAQENKEYFSKPR